MLFKKNVAASDSPRAIRVARARPFGYQIPSSRAALEVAHHFFFWLYGSCIWWRHDWLPTNFFFPPLYFLSLDLEIHVNLSKNTIVSSNLYFYQFWISIFLLLFVLFLMLLNLDFFLISSLEDLFNFVFLSNMILILFITFFSCFILFLNLLVFNFVFDYFIAFIFIFSFGYFSFDCYFLILYLFYF